MSRIKSAWEIALEKTADIKIDENKLRKDELLKQGMAIAGNFLNDMQKDVSSVIENLASFSKEDAELVRNGIKQVVLSNIALPNDDTYQLRFSRTSQLAEILNPQSVGTMEQVGSFLAQYMAAREDFVKRMQDQITEMMKNNPQQANSAQYSKLIEQNLKKMEDQYSEALASTIEELKEIL